MTVPKAFAALQLALDGEMPEVVLNQSLPDGAMWYSRFSLPVIHLAPDVYIEATSFLSEMCGGVIVNEGDA